MTTAWVAWPSLSVKPLVYALMFTSASSARAKDLWSPAKMTRSSVTTSSPVATMRASFTAMLVALPRWLVPTPNSCGWLVPVVSVS
ncbi:hypothetical protein D3C72_2159710 [compost metagenome]